MDWHAEASRQLRSVSNSQAWLLQQVRGDCFRHAFDCLPTLLSDAFLRLAGFLPGDPAVRASWIPEEVQLEDDYAVIAGGFAMSLLQHRARRTLWLTSAFLTRW